MALGFSFILGLMLIGLTGGIGSGKSTVAKRWVELGATEIDADQLAREVVYPGTQGLQLVSERFGLDLIQGDGSLNRQLLAQRAFADAQSRKDLESILHPLIQALAKEKVAGVQGHVIYTIPLLVETNSQLPFDKVVTVSCPEEVRLQRLVESRGMSKEDALARIASQATDALREARADVVIDSNCSLSELEARADSTFKALTA
jgi:dephospho-CoA kinase